MAFDPSKVDLIYAEEEEARSENGEGQGAEEGGQEGCQEGAQKGEEGRAQDPEEGGQGQQAQGGGSEDHLQGAQSPAGRDGQGQGEVFQEGQEGAVEEENEESREEGQEGCQEVREGPEGGRGGRSRSPSRQHCQGRHQESQCHNGRMWQVGQIQAALCQQRSRLPPPPRLGMGWPKTQVGSLPCIPRRKEEAEEETQGCREARPGEEGAQEAQQELLLLQEQDEEADQEGHEQS